MTLCGIHYAGIQSGAGAPSVLKLGIYLHLQGKKKMVPFSCLDECHFRPLHAHLNLLWQGEGDSVKQMMFCLNNITKKIHPGGKSIKKMFLLRRFLLDKSCSSSENQIELFLYLCALLLILFLAVQPLVGDLSRAILLDQVAVSLPHPLLLSCHSDFHEVEVSGDWAHSQVDGIPSKQHATRAAIFLETRGLIILGSDCTGRGNSLRPGKPSSISP